LRARNLAAFDGAPGEALQRFTRAAGWRLLIHKSGVEYLLRSQAKDGLVHVDTVAGYPALF
jgi:hypothetical protein